MFRIPILRLLLALIAAFSFATTQGASPTLTTSHGVYVVGENVTIGFTNGPANAKDWIAIANASAEPGTSDYLVYQYADGGSGAAGLSEGEVTFNDAALPAGDYVAYFYEDDGYRILARDAFKVIEATTPQVRVNKPVYSMGEPITVTFSNGPGNPQDRIALFPAGATPGGNAAAIKFVDNTDTGTTGLTSGTVTFESGLAQPGPWVAYLLENGSFNPLASEPFDVALTATPTVTLQMDHATYAPGQPMRIAFSGGPGDPQDWIGIYLDGQRPGDPISLDWRYVNNTQGSTVGISNGEVVIPAPTTAGLYRAFFLLDDLYGIAGMTTFRVSEPGLGVVQTSKQIYMPNEPIAVAFTNATGFAQDWVAIYPSGIIPDGTPSSTLYKYTDNTTTGTPGITEGTVDFPTGLPVGDYTVFLMENDGYFVMAQEDFSVRESGVQTVRLLSLSPADNEANALASPRITAVLENRQTQVATPSIRLVLDAGTPNERVLTPQITTTGDRVSITATIAEILAAQSAHTVTLSYNDNTGQAFSNLVHFTVGDVTNITLPTPIWFENFDATAEGSVPTGWTVSNQSDPTNIAADLHNLGSAAYDNFTVVSTTRLAGNFLAYDDTTETGAPLVDILSRSDDSFVVNGTFLRNLASGNVLVALSGYHWDGNQSLEAIAPSIDTSGQTGVTLAFHSLLQQNQDAIAGVEVSIDGGATWKPVIYYLDPDDIIRTGETVDLEATFNTVRADITKVGENGGFYGYFLKAPIDAAAGLATQPRANDSAQDGTRVEVIPVPAADNQASVKFRFFYAGSDSWYFGVDNVGVYSITGDVEGPRITVARDATNITLTWPASPGYVLQSVTSLPAAPGDWQNVAGVTGDTYTTSTATGNRFFRLFKP